MSGISIKPDRSPGQRAIESVLLKERRWLITAGKDRRDIKLHGNCLYLNNKKVGSVIDSVFQQCLLPSSEPSLSAPTMPNDDSMLSVSQNVDSHHGDSTDDGLDTNSQSNA